MKPIAGFDFFALTFDQNGVLPNNADLVTLTDHLAAAKATDVVLIAHGFRNDEADATTLYAEFLRNLRGHLSKPEFAAVAARRVVIGGVYWPSKPFREVGVDEPGGTRDLARVDQGLHDARARLESLRGHDATPAQRRRITHAISLLPRLETDADAQDAFVKDVLSLVGRSPADPTEGLPQIRRRSGSEMFGRLQSADEAGARGIGDALSSIGGRVGQFLNLTTWFVMKNRSGIIGAKGVTGVVRDVHARQPTLRIHLVGHSLGGRVMASCAKALSAAPVVRPDSLTLLEAAFSHFGFSADNGHGQSGFFRDVVAQQVVKGPFLSTFSEQDTVVGYAYSIMSRLAGDNTRAVGDASDEFGGIGRNGPLRTAEVVTTPLHAPGQAYAFRPAVINNLNGSGGLVKDHGDVANEAITYAFASALAQT